MAKNVDTQKFLTTKDSPHKYIIIFSYDICVCSCFFLYLMFFIMKTKLYRFLSAGVLNPVFLMQVKMKGYVVPLVNSHKLLQFQIFLDCSHFLFLSHIF